MYKIMAQRSKLSKMAAPPVYREITFYFIQFTFLVLNFDADNVFKCTFADFQPLCIVFKCW